LCPKDTGKDIRETFAICEICEMAICSNHAIKDNGKHSCYDRETPYDNNTSSMIEEKIKDMSTSLNSLKTLFKQKKVIYKRKKISALIKINSMDYTNISRHHMPFPNFLWLFF
jgi:hypothetical protein